MTDGGGGRAYHTATSLWHTTVAALWCIRLHRLSRTQAQYLQPSSTEMGTWEDMWATMQQLTNPAAHGFLAQIIEGPELYGALCPRQIRLQHLSCCRLLELVHVQQPGDRRLHWMPNWRARVAIRRRTSITLFGEQAAPPTFQAAAY